jgi:biotin-dependent carboxylase-like uncharacterized protein
VLLWPDTFNNYFKPDTARAAVEVLEAAGCDVVVPSAEVSRRHAEIAPGAEGYVVSDTSTNGVFVNGERVRQSQLLGRGDVLRIGAARGNDVRGYLAVAGGLALSPVLGSLSTHVRTRLGGMDGQPLQPGDVLPLRVPAAPGGADLALDPADLPRREAVLRVILGPQDDHFTAAGRETFLSAEFTISREADRMGYRLAGPVIEHDPARGYNIISDGIPSGAVQVPGTGLPIVLGPDRQTTGGYPRIGEVASVDLPLVAQLKAGDRLRFRPISLDEAQRLYLAREDNIRQARAAIALHHH